VYHRSLTCPLAAVVAFFGQFGQGAGGKGAQVVGESVFQQQAFGFRLQRATGDLFFFGIKSGGNVSRDHSIVFTHKRKI